MTVQRVPGPAAPRPEELLEAAIGKARAADRADLVERLSGTRRLLHAPIVTALVAGDAQQGTTSLVDALSGPGLVATEETGAAAHAAVVVSDAAQPLTAPEIDRLHRIHHRCPTVLFALTKIDLYPRWRDVFEADLAQLRDAAIPVEAFAVSALLHSHAADDHTLATASGVPALVARLHTVGEEAEATTTRAAAQQVLSAVSELEGSPRPRATPRGDARAGPPPADPGRSADRARWTQVLGDGFAAASSDLDFDLRTRVRTVLAEAERAIDEGNPARNWPAFDAWLGHRLTHEAQHTFALLAERTGQVAASLTAHVGPDAPLGSVRHPDPPDLLQHLTPRDPPSGHRRPVAARGRTLLMSAYGGVMMSLILPRYAGLAVPAWLVVAGALTAALLMGAAAISGERKRQLDRRRSHAKTLVRHCTDGFLLSAGKHVRDALRCAQQQLRDECQARVAELPRPGAPAGAPTAAREPHPQLTVVRDPEADLAALRRHALTLLGPVAEAR